MNIYFLSDVHLSEKRPRLTELFFSFLNDATDAKALYILGDLFEVWIGDDNLSSLNIEVAKAINEYSTSNNIPVYFIHGNRDFLIGQKFAKLANMQLLPDPYILNVNDKKILLTHGDLLCTNDKKYQFFRKVVRNKLVNELFLLFPLFIRKKIATFLRGKSKSAYNKNKENNNDNNYDNIYDVANKTVEKYFNYFQVNTLIHGHTHKKNIHETLSKDLSFKRLVLGDWGKFGSFIKLSIEPKSYNLTLNDYPE